MNPYAPCILCPRRCDVDRSAITGYCGESNALRIASASIHRGEEPPLTGGPEGGGSGTIFASGCNLGCVFCQNRQITGRPGTGEAGSRANHALGRVVTTEEFARICLALQNAGAENINIVTGSHAVPAIVAGIAAARAGFADTADLRDGRLTIPVLWNSSAYELPETVELLADTVDVFLPDMKTLDSALAMRYFNAPDYPEAAAGAIEKMMRLSSLQFEAREHRPARMVSGVMIRHLVLPGHLESTRTVLHWFAEHCAGKALLSLMFQYTPIAETEDSGPVKTANVPDRFVAREEYETVLDWLTEFGIEDGYCQDLLFSDDWLPDFERANPFPSDLSVPVWHWKSGFLC
jgi:putative pyruvate formate lyase activating enzyme